MSPIDQIKTALVAEFPDVEIVVRKADDPKGMQFLNLYSGDLEIAIEWKPDRGFGLSSLRSDAHEMDEAYDAPDEWYKSPTAVFHRICSLLIDQQTTKAITMPGVHPA